MGESCAFLGRKQWHQQERGCSCQGCNVCARNASIRGAGFLHSACWCTCKKVERCSQPPPSHVAIVDRMSEARETCGPSVPSNEAAHTFQDHMAMKSVDTEQQENSKALRPHGSAPDVVLEGDKVWAAAPVSSELEGAGKPEGAD